MRACKCPNCGANLDYQKEQFESGFCFCQYCGTKIMLDDYRSIHIHKVVDEARLKEAELHQAIKLKELEIAENRRLEEKEEKKAKRRAIIVKIWILIMAIIIGFVYLINSDFLKPGEEIDWTNIRLGYLLPEPKSNWIDSHDNSKTRLDIDVYDLTTNDRLEYIRLCEEAGYVIALENSDTKFKAYNPDGYFLELTFYSYNDYINITLEEPTELNEYKLPCYATAANLPIPISNLGYYQWEESTAFYLHVGNTTKEEYDSYKNACIEAGFNIESHEYGYSEKYSAQNQDGFELDISYGGFYTLSIILRCPEGFTDNEVENKN